MKRLFPLVVIGVIILILGAFLLMSFTQARAYLSARVVMDARGSLTTVIPLAEPSLYLSVSRVIDGDTVDVVEKGGIIRVRLIGINTPETVDPRTPVECFGKESSKKTAELLAGGLVRLEDDVSQGRYDKYQRRLAYLFTPDGTFVNFELVKQGYAFEYTYRAPYKYQAEFKEAQKEARMSERGLWAPGVCER